MSSSIGLKILAVAFVGVALIAATPQSTPHYGRTYPCNSSAPAVGVTQTIVCNSPAANANIDSCSLFVTHPATTAVQNLAIKACDVYPIANDTTDCPWLVASAVTASVQHVNTLDINYMPRGLTGKRRVFWAEDTATGTSINMVCRETTLGD